VGGGWQYEPKWDGFRCLAFRDGREVRLQSKSGRPLARYFPDAVEAMLEVAAERFVLDGELVIPVGERLSFEELQLRLHPAASRVRKLAAEHPAVYVAFDLLVDADGSAWAGRPFAARRGRLEAFARERFGAARVRLAAATRDEATARTWLESVGGAVDGVVAKRLDAPYAVGERGAMRKVKPQRTADCVVGGFRYAARGGAVGSLLLGLYDEGGRLHHVGFAAALPAAERRGWTVELERLRDGHGAGPRGFTGRAPGGPSRWSRERTGEYEPLPHRIVVEVGWDHVSGGRFRHGTRLVRRRPDKPPSRCGFDQFPAPARLSFETLADDRGPARHGSGRA